MDKTEQFIELYTRHERQLYRYIANLTYRIEDVDDILQNTSTTLWRKFDEYDPDRPFVSWAFAFAYNEVRNYRHKQRTKKKYFSDELIESLAVLQEENHEVLKEQRKHLKGCMAKLEEKDRFLLEHRYCLDGTIGDLATRTGQTANALYKSLQRIRRNLQLCIKAEMTEAGS